MPCLVLHNYIANWELCPEFFEQFLSDHFSSTLDVSIYKHTQQAKDDFFYLGLENLHDEITQYFNKSHRKKSESYL